MAPPDSSIEARLARLEAEVAALAVNAAAESPRDTSRSPDTPAFWALEGLLDRHPAGAVLLAGAADVPQLGPVRWQYQGRPDEILATDPHDAASVLEALAHPVRISLLGLVLSGVRGTAELLDRQELGSTGQLHHHLRTLLAAGWLTSPARGQYQVPPTRVVPLLAILLAARRP